eukprot:1196277-Prorocentrum_minimum.AAC.1
MVPNFQNEYFSKYLRSPLNRFETRIAVGSTGGNCKVENLELRSGKDRFFWEMQIPNSAESHEKSSDLIGSPDFLNCYWNRNWRGRILARKMFALLVQSWTH